MTHTEFLNPLSFSLSSLAHRASDVFLQSTGL
jgi:hypothetical protein